ncbi:membrane protein [[Actinobacillus] muris]|uniref:Membrane protein n=1 Tax=Muribacter muris TaxID=67855 RepID=A0A0J5P7A3_9PAST|nr:DMT family transporter [Muribacter muris]KMK51660.1 membrane protein [[Actinobacillus] muris] [Muribacter muris]
MKDRSAALLLILGCVLFGLGSLIVKFVPVGTYAIAFWRLLIATGIFWLLLKLYRKPLPRNRKAIGWAALSGVLLAFDLAFWHESIHAVGPGISTLLNSLQIFFLAAIGWLFFHEKQSKMQLFSLILAVIGVLLIASPELSHNLQGGYGIFIGLLSGACLAGSMAAIRQAHQAQPIALFPLMWIISFSGALALILPALWLNADTLYPTTAKDVGLIVIYGIVMQCIAWGLIAYTIPKLSLGLTGLLLLTEPIAALLIDAFWLAKPINASRWCGAFLTLLAIYLGSSRDKH